MGNGHRTRRDRRARHRRPPGPGADIIAGVGGIAPIVGPLLGAVILQLSHWRVSFWVVAALGLVMTLAVVRPSPSHCRPSGGTAAACIRSWLPAGRSSGTGAMSATWWWPGRRWVPCSPVATSAFALQSMNGISPLAYSIDFAANAAGMTVASLIAARLAGRIATRTVILVGQLAALAAGVAMLIGAIWFGTPLILAIICFFVMMTAQGLIGPNGGALASAAVPDHPGSGSAVLGFVQWVAAGIIAPIAGLGGEHTAVPMASLMIAGARRLHDRTARHREARGNADPSGTRCAGLS
jgi:MFS transporter, DHA1 family, multidrug resistance protein